MASYAVTFTVNRVSHTLAASSQASLFFGSANTWCQDFHLAGFVPCTAHTFRFRRARLHARRLQLGVRPLHVMNAIYGRH